MKRFFTDFQKLHFDKAEQFYGIEKTKVELFPQYFKSILLINIEDIRDVENI
jgi:hypothetical protein